MEELLTKFDKMGEFGILYGPQLLWALVILVVGLILAKKLSKYLRNTLGKLGLKPAAVSITGNIFFILFIFFVITAAMEEMELRTELFLGFLGTVCLAAIGLIVAFRPILPTLPFKVGNTVKTGNLLGKVEAITILNTRLRSFDGKTVFVPNTKILNDYVINYHFTPTRRFKLDVGIGYDQDLVKAKQVLEAVMIEDPRVLNKPRPVVYVLNLADSCVELGGRGWVDNLKYWTTRCELLEKVKLRFDQEGITIAYPQRDVHLYHEVPLPELAAEETFTPEKSSSEKNHLIG